MNTARTARKPPLLYASDTAQVRRELRRLAGGALLAALDEQLALALQGSDEAAREYVRSYRALTVHVLAAAHRLYPDLVARTPDDQLAVVDAKGRPSRAPVGALETASAEAPFGPWTRHYALGDAVALDLVSRVRQLIGLRALDLPGMALRTFMTLRGGRVTAATPPPGAVSEVADELAAERFLRRVRFYLNHPDEQHPLRRVTEAFGLSKTELAKLFGVRRQAVDQWLERGVPGDRQEKLQTLVALCDLLERKLKADRLPGVARRAADAYGGKTMLELIAEDRHRELLELVRDSFDWASAA